MANELSDIRIEDPHVKAVVDKNRRRRQGDSGTNTKTAGQMLLEYDAILEAREAAGRQAIAASRKPRTSKRDLAGSTA